MREHVNGSHQDISSNVYIVYGHNNDNAVRGKICNFLEQLGLQLITKEMAASWTGEGTPFVGRIIDAVFDHAQAVIVLLTGEDRVRLRKELQKSNDALYEREFYPQPDLDQIFEVGYAFGKYPERTILLQVGQVRPFSDIAGRDVLNFTGKEEEYRSLKDRLKSVESTLKDNGVALSTPVVKETNPKRVFVVHGRNERAEREVFRFLRMLNLSPISWREAVKATNTGAPYTGKVLEALLSEAQAVLVLLTGDDEKLLGSVFSAEEYAKEAPQVVYLPRPNVIFEAGMAFSNRRLADRTILVEVGNVMICESIVGRDRVKLSDKMKHRWDLAYSLQNAGCSVQVSDYELVRRIGNFNFD